MSEPEEIEYWNKEKTWKVKMSFKRGAWYVETYCYTNPRESFCDYYRHFELKQDAVKAFGEQKKSIA